MKRFLVLGLLCTIVLIANADLIVNESLLFNGIQNYGGSIILGDTDTGTITQTGGSVTIDKILAVGFGDGVSGTYLLENGQLETAMTVLGVGGIGNFIQNDGLHVVEMGVALGVDDNGRGGGSGIYQLTGGHLYTNKFWIGESQLCTGNFELCGGTVTVDNPISSMTNNWLDIGSTGIFSFESGRLEVLNTSITDLQALFDNGMIETSGMVSIVDEGGYTVAAVVAAPEPATLIIMGIGVISALKRKY